MTHRRHRHRFSFFVASIENPTDKSFVFDGGADFQVDFAASEHFRSEQGVFHGEQRIQVAEEAANFELGNEFQFVCPTVATDRTQKGLLKCNDPLARWMDTVSFDGNLFEGIHDTGNVDRFRTAGRTGQA